MNTHLNNPLTQLYRRAALRFLLSVFCLVSLAACQSGVQRTDVDFAQAQLNWSRFIELSALPQTGSASAPFSAVLSIRYKTPEDGQRFAAYFWGNLRQNTVYPVRLDVQGFMGATAAKLIEDKRNFLLYDTENNIAYLSEGSQQTSQQTLLQVGLPLPMRLGDLALLLNGRYQDFFMPGQDSTMPQAVAGNAQLEYTYNLQQGPRSGELTLNSLGQPVSWAEYGAPENYGEQGWRFDFVYPQGTQSAAMPGPYRIEASHPSGYSVTVQIKSFSRPDKAFSPEQLDLILPPDAKIETS